MYLTHLRVVNFRNHVRTDVALGPGMHIFVGANAQGKSNLLEAVGVAATGRSHRTVHDLELIRIGAAWARVRAVVCRKDRTVELDIGFRTDGASAEHAHVWKELRVNGVPTRRGDLFGQLVVVAVSPEGSEVTAGPPVVRRRMLDLILAQGSPSYFYTAQRYARVLLHRNRALRAAGARQLEGWDEQVAVLGAEITGRRQELVDHLARGAAAAYRALSGRTEELTLRYLPSLSGEDQGARATAALTALAARRREELARGSTLVGPHRDELQLCVDGREVRVFGSRGQQQAVLLALRLAERQVLREATGEEPVLLLDDALVALDEERQAYLIDQVQAGPTLITLTTLGTAQSMLRDAPVYRVVAGTVERLHAHRI